MREQGDTRQGTEPTLPSSRCPTPPRCSCPGQTAAGMNAPWWHPVSTRSQRVRGDNNTRSHDTVLTWHCRQLLFLSQKIFSGGIQTALTGRFALCATEWRLLRPPEDKYFNLVLCLGVFFFPSSAETEAFDVAMFTAPKMKKVKERGQLSTWEHLTN